MTRATGGLKCWARMLMTVAGSSRPEAGRFVPPRVRDARRVVGALLLFGGFGGALHVVSGFDRSVPMWSVRHDVLPGHRVERADLVLRRVYVPGDPSAYLGARLPLPQERFARHFLGAGELLARSALGPSSDVGTRVVEVLVDGPGTQLGPGRQVEVWVARRSGDDSAPHYEHAVRMFDRVVVGGLAREVIPSPGGGQKRSVVLHVPAVVVDRVIDVANSKDRITLVPVGAP